MNKYDKIIIGAGIFGMYAALKALEKGQSVLILEYDDEPFLRASYINQARVHNGYHYPRSFSTAKKSAYYFERFVDDFGFAIVQDFKKIYATSTQYSFANSEQFKRFCEASDIPCNEVDGRNYFRPNMCDGVFETREYTFDAKIICQYLFDKLMNYSNCEIKFGVRILELSNDIHYWSIATQYGVFITEYLINATYASLNQLLKLANLEPFKMKYELCEVILCKVSDNIKNVGLTVMDGPFFSLMPFGKTGYHSLTSVMHTPHFMCRDNLPTFSCQEFNNECSNIQLANCQLCDYKPKTAFNSMYKLAKSYLNDDIDIIFQKSLFSMKSLLLTSEIDDSRPTIIKLNNETPRFLSVFSGKINTIYDLDEVIE